MSVLHSNVVILADTNHVDGSWTGTTDPKLRRRLQNRINQRTSRHRKAAKKEAERSAASSAPPVSNPKCRTILPKGTYNGAWRGIHSPERDGKSKYDDKSRGSVPASLDLMECIQPALAEMNTKRIFHYTIQTLLPTLGAKTSSGEILSAVLYRTAMLDPLVFYSTIVGGAGQRLILTQSADDSQTYIRAQSKIARAIREALSRNEISDGLLFAIMSLSLRPNQYSADLLPEERYQGAFHSPVKDVGGLSWLGLLELAPEHASMLLRLLRDYGTNRTNRNRVKSIMPGLAEYLQLADLLRASLALDRPEMPLTESYYSILMNEARTIRPPMHEAEAFRVDNDEIKRIILDMRLCSRLIDTFSGRLAFDSETSRFVQYRDLIQYRILQLPHEQYYFGRLALTIYSYGIIFPIPDPRPMQRLIQQLSCALSNSELTMKENKGFLLWVAFIGGIAAYRGGFYEFFVALVAQYAGDLNLHNWYSVVRVLEKFIWLGRGCDTGGQELWINATMLRGINVSCVTENDIMPSS